MFNSADLVHLRRCVELAREALEAGDFPFGCVLADGTGKVLREDRNRQVTERDVTLHPELTLAVWAQKNRECFRSIVLYAYIISIEMLHLFPSVF